MPAITGADWLQEEIGQLGQARIQDQGNLHGLGLDGWVGCVVDIVKEGLQPAPVPPNDAVKGFIEACTHDYIAQTLAKRAGTTQAVMIK